MLGRRAPARYIWVGAFIVLGDRCATSVPAGYALAGVSAVSVGGTYGASIVEERVEKEVENGENWRLAVWLRCRRRDGSSPHDTATSRDYLYPRPSVGNPMCRGNMDFK